MNIPVKLYFRLQCRTFVAWNGRVRKVPLEGRVSGPGCHHTGFWSSINPSLEFSWPVPGLAEGPQSHVTSWETLRHEWFAAGASHGTVPASVGPGVAARRWQRVGTNKRARRLSLSSGTGPCVYGHGGGAPLGSFCYTVLILGAGAQSIQLSLGGPLNAVADLVEERVVVPVLPLAVWSTLTAAPSVCLRTSSLVRLSLRGSRVDRRDLGSRLYRSEPRPGKVLGLELKVGS